MTGKSPKHWRSPTRDHVVARSRGGGGGPLILVCLACNQDKGPLSLHEWHRHLRAVGDPRAERVFDVLVELDQSREALRNIAVDYRGKPMPDAVIVSAAQTANGGFDRATLEAWGVPWPPPKGWKSQLKKFGIPFIPKAQEAES